VKKVCFFVRETSKVSSGGDVVQLVNTAAHLCKERYKVLITSNKSDVIAFEPDILHFSGINLQYNFQQVVELANGLKNKPFLVMSSIYVNYEGFEREIRNSTIVGFLLRVFGYIKLEYIKELFRNRRLSLQSVVYLLVRTSMYNYKSLLPQVDLFLPNSELEKDSLIKGFGVEPKKVKVIPNGVQFIDVDASLPQIPYSNFILCVARVEELKNQHLLLQACRDLGLNLVLIGGLAPSQKSYYRNKILPLLDDDRVYLGELPHGELAQYYAACNVHALVSHFETCGLSSLEAAFFGKKLVVSDVGYVRSCLGDAHYYCDPTDINSIKDALVLALSKDNYTDFTPASWKEVADFTSSSYEGSYQ
jgi:glycosyltransferase involved in cell wall biosynthesis